MKCYVCLLKINGIVLTPQRLLHNSLLKIVRDFPPRVISIGKCVCISYMHQKSSFDAVVGFTGSTHILFVYYKILLGIQQLTAALVIQENSKHS